jgi:hypothetical protein
MQGKAVEVLKLLFCLYDLKGKLLALNKPNKHKDIYNSHTIWNVVSFSFDSFINARVVDTDICMDIF